MLDAKAKREQKEKAQNKVSYALRSGRLKRGKKCEECGWKQPSYTLPHGLIEREKP